MLGNVGMYLPSHLLCCPMRQTFQTLYPSTEAAADLVPESTLGPSRGLSKTPPAAPAGHATSGQGVSVSAGGSGRIAGRGRGGEPSLSGRRLYYPIYYPTDLFLGRK
jgi:hypothetical protein